MKRIKHGIRKDFDRINHKSKEEILASAGVITEPSPDKRPFMGLRLAASMAACIMLIALGATLAFAMEDTQLSTRIKDILGVEQKEENKTYICNIEKIHFVCYEEDYKSTVLSSFDEIAEIIGTDFYYPAYGFEHSELTVRYSASDVDGSEETAYHSLQMDAHGAFVYFWFQSRTDTAGAHVDENTVLYEKHGAVFAINDASDSENPNSEGNYFATGIIEGCRYSFLTDTLENAKAVIDSLRKTGE